MARSSQAPADLVVDAEFVGDPVVERFSEKLQAAITKIRPRADLALLDPPGSGRGESECGLRLHIMEVAMIRQEWGFLQNSKNWARVGGSFCGDIRSRVAGFE